MVSLCGDQAAGLRELFAAGGPQPMTLAFAGVGVRTMLVAELARALAAAGKEVLILDEQAGAGRLAAAFGLRSRFDLLQAVQGDVAPAQVVMRPEPAIRLVPMARAVRRHAGLDAALRSTVRAWLARLQEGADVVLVETAMPLAALRPSLAGPISRHVVCVSPEGVDLTAAYAHIKQLERGEGGSERIGIVVQRAGSEQVACDVFERLQEVAARHLGIGLERLGAGKLADRDLAAALAGQMLAGEAQAPAGCAPRTAARRRSDAYPAVV